MRSAFNQLKRLCDQFGGALACLPDGTIGPADGSSSRILALGSAGEDLLLEAQNGQFRFSGDESATILGVRSRRTDETSFHLYHAASGEALRHGEATAADRFRLLPATASVESGLLPHAPASFTVDGNGLRLLFNHGGAEMVPVVHALMPLLGVAEVRSQWAAVVRKEKAPFLDAVRDYSRGRLQHFRHFTRDILRHDIELWGWSVGDKTYGAPLILEPSLGKLTIGRYCSMANPTIILGNHSSNTATTYPFMSLWIEWPGTTVAAGIDDHVGRDVTIGNDVWIGHQAIILPGATIGDGAVIGAGSVVRGTIPPYAICTGNPGRLLRYRFNENIIARLRRLEWWHWPDTVVDRYLPRILSQDIGAFLSEAEAEFLGLTDAGAM